MNDDLNTPHVLGQVFDAVSAGDAARVSGYLNVLGFRTVTPSPQPSPLKGEGEAEQLLVQRQAARKNKDFALADKIRDQLSALGYIVEDTPQGARLIKKE
jgi:cysteinyl-tRNA synthetase